MSTINFATTITATVKLTSSFDKVLHAMGNARQVFHGCTVLKLASSMQSITDTSQLKHGESYTLTSEDVLDVEVEEDQQVTAVPWFDASTGKAFKNAADGVEEALAVVPGPNGIAIECFQSGAMEVPGHLNSDVVEVQNGEEKKVLTRAAEVIIIHYVMMSLNLVFLSYP